MEILTSDGIMGKNGFEYSIQKDFNIRCLTAGITVDRQTIGPDLERAVEFLGDGKRILEEDGYSVQMIRLSTNPFPDYCQDLSIEEARGFIKGMAEFAREQDVFLSIGPLDPLRDPEGRLLDVLCPILAETDAFAGITICSAVEGILRAGIVQAAEAMARLVGMEMMGNFQLAALAHIPPETPFFPAAFHEGEEHKFTIGTESAHLVLKALERAGDREHLFPIMTAIMREEFRALEETARSIGKETGWIYGGLDTSPAPMKEVSIGRAIEGITAAPFGSAGTLSACAGITRIIQSLDISTAGYCGLMLPVMEDVVLAQRAAEGRYGLTELLAFSAVCGTGLDVIPLPGDVSRTELQNLLADIASLADRLMKPLSARLIPIPGKGAGEGVELDSPYLVPTKIFSI